MAMAMPAATIADDLAIITSLHLSQCAPDCEAGSCAS